MLCDTAIIHHSIADQIHKMVDEDPFALEDFHAQSWLYL